MSKLSHFNEQGHAHMVDVSEKTTTARIASAKGVVIMHPDTATLILENRAQKGDVLGVARLAGIMGAKKTPDLIPLCHPLPLAKVSLEFTTLKDRVEIVATVKTTGQTGVEMEALTAVTIAALTIYDMLKAVDKAMQITDIRLVLKDGGKSGRYENL